MIISFAGHQGTPANSGASLPFLAPAPADQAKGAPAAPAAPPVSRPTRSPQRPVAFKPIKYTVPPWLKKLAEKPAAAGSPTQSLLVKLSARPTNSAQIEAMPRGAERKAAAWSALVQTASASQKPFIELAEKLKTSGAIAGYEALVSPNMLIVTPASGKAAEVLSAFSVEGVAAIYDNRGGDQRFPMPAGIKDAAKGAQIAAPRGIVSTAQPTWGYDTQAAAEATDASSVEPRGFTYGVQAIGMPEAWKQGATGAGMVYGMIDSGAQWTHPALRDAYRGSTPSGADHDYNWMDFEGSSPMPIDARGHGTHVVGSVVGKTETAHIGVAPEAKFIVARGTGTGRVDSALRALQWMQAPTKRDGSAPNPAMAPDVVGMSWWMGSPREELFRDSILNLRLAGIEPVKSAGNKGDGPSTITSPGHFAEIYAVAAVDKNNQVADFSSRGNALIPSGSPTSKPDFAAPGVSIMSSVPGNGYGEKDGTSMAQPHFSGALLAIMSKYPQLTHDQLTQVLAAGATDAGPEGRDTAYGMGIINVPRSLQAAAQLLAGGEVTVAPLRKAASVAA